MQKSKVKVKVKENDSFGVSQLGTPVPAARCVSVLGCVHWSSGIPCATTDLADEFSSVPWEKKIRKNSYSHGKQYSIICPSYRMRKDTSSYRLPKWQAKFSPGLVTECGMRCSCRTQAFLYQLRIEQPLGQLIAQTSTRMSSIFSAKME